MKQNNKLLILFLIFFALFIRFYLINLPPFKIDIDAWVAWSLRLHEVGFANFYSPTYFSDYLPGYLYILYLEGFIPIFFSTPLENFAIILKILPSLVEVGIGIFIFYILNKCSFNRRLVAASLIWFNPGLIFNSTVWGQADSVLTIFLIISVYFLAQNKPTSSSITAALSFLVKPQTVLITPLYLLDLVTRFSLNRLLQFIIPVPLVLFIFSWPFFQNPFFGLIEKTLSTANGYQYTSLFAFNLWGIIGMWQQDSIYYTFFTYQQWGTILFLLFWIFISIIFIKRKFSYYLLASLASLSFFFLPTRVHERYLYPAIPFLVISIFIIKSKYQKLLLTLTITLSVLYLLNLYYVYIYYNENYLQLPKVLTFSPLYNFLDQNLKLLSFIQTTIFIMISWTLLKTVYAQKSEKNKQKP